MAITSINATVFIKRRTHTVLVTIFPLNNTSLLSFLYSLQGSTNISVHIDLNNKPLFNSLAA